MVCKECGKENKDDAAYCDGCGATLKKKRRKKGRFFAAIGILAAAVIAGAVVKNVYTGGTDWQASGGAGNSYDETAAQEVKNEYKLNETFELDGLYFNFTKAFSNDEYGFWESSSDEKVLAGFEGTVQNYSDYDVNLQNYAYTIEFINGNGKKQQTTEPMVECYGGTGDYSTSSIIGSGREGDIYIFLSPDADCEALKMTIQTSSGSEEAVVKNTLYCNGSYESEDGSSLTRLAKGYSEDLACIQFYADEREYYGYMDKNADMIFRFSSKYEDTFCEPPTDFENGYIHYEYGNTMYVMDKDGKITSKYDGGEGEWIAYGSGYTCMEASTAGFDGNGFEYTMYRPDGTVADTFNCGTEVTVKYLGKGTFLYQYYDDDGEEIRRYYFVDGDIWVQADMEVDTEDIKVCDKWLYNGIFTENGINDYLDLYDKKGESVSVELPRELCGSDVWVRVNDISDKYILLEVETEDEDGYEHLSLWIYNMESKEFKNYQGEYLDSIDEDGYNNKIFQDSIVISLKGGDGKDYIGLVNTGDLSEIGEPIQVRGVDVYKDIMAVEEETTSDVQQTLYDSKGNVVYTYTVEDYTGWLGGFDNNTMLTGCGYDYNEDGSIVKHRFMDYSGKSLFDEINYLAGSETDLSVNTAAEE